MPETFASILLIFGVGVVVHHTREYIQHRRLQKLLDRVSVELAQQIRKEGSDATTKED